MKIVFRADGSVEIGTGHLMRCLALAYAFQNNGAAVEFICAPLQGSAHHLVERAGFPIRQLSVGKSVKEVEEVAAYLKGANWLVVDHYGLNGEWAKQVRSHAGAALKIAVISDSQTETYECDFMVNTAYLPNLQESARQQVPAGTKVRVGPQYAFLRQEFLDLREHAVKRPFTRSPASVLLFFGGTDPRGATLKSLKWLSADVERNYFLNVVIGSLNPQRAEVERLVATMKDARIMVDTPDMAKLMISNDLYVGAGGTVTFERMALGLPAIVVTIADNQVATSKALAEDGYHLYLGDIDSLNAEKFCKSISSLLLNEPLRRELFSRSMKLVDGKGCQRFMEELQ